MRRFFLSQQELNSGVFGGDDDFHDTLREHQSANDADENAQDQATRQTSK